MRAKKTFPLFPATIFTAIKYSGNTLANPQRQVDKTARLFNF